MRNGPKDLLTPDEYFIYKILGYPLNVYIVYNALKKKLLVNPEYEVWVPFTYYKSTTHTKKGKFLLAPDKIIISNKGRILSLREEPPRELNHRIVNSYVVTSFTFDKNEGHVLIHRAMACSFIPPTKDVVGIPMIRLQVNHLDGDKTNYTIDNLEWCTASVNACHAHDTGLATALKGLERTDTKPTKGVVTVGTYKGYEFILCGAKSSNEQGFNPSYISRAALGIVHFYRNCSWSFATEEEIKTLPQIVPPKVLCELDTFNPKVKSWILATNQVTGERLIITGGRVELQTLGFTSQAVSLVISGKYKYHKGYGFERIPR